MGLLRSQKTIMCFIAFVAIALLTIVLFIATSRPPRDVEIWFGQSVSQIKGYSWQVVDNNPASSVAIYHVRLKLHLPDKSVLQTEANCIYVDRDNGIVSMVNIILLEKPVDFKSAVMDCERIARRMGISGNDSILRTLRKFEDIGPGLPYDNEHTAKTNIGGSVIFGLDIKKEPGTDSEGRNWNVWLTVLRKIE